MVYSLWCMEKAMTWTPGEVFVKMDEQRGSL